MSVIAWRNAQRKLRLISLFMNIQDLAELGFLKPRMANKLLKLVGSTMKSSTLAVLVEHKGMPEHRE